MTWGFLYPKLGQSGPMPTLSANPDTTLRPSARLHRFGTNQLSPGGKSMSDSTAQTQAAAQATPAPVSAAPAPVPGPPPTPQPSTSAPAQQASLVSGPEAKVFSADYVQALRAESAGYRVRANETSKTLEQTKAQLGALTAVQQELDTLKAQIAQRDQTASITKALQGRNASPITLDAMRGAGLFNEFDWTAQDTTSKLTELVDGYLKEHPELVQATSPARSGAPMSGGTNEPTGQPASSLEAAINAAYRPK